MRDKPDILLIVLDTQRADRLGCFGYEKAITPHLDQFARESALFTQAVSPAQWTVPSHASFFTGLYPTVHQVTQSFHSLSDQTPHIAEKLAAEGYQTVGFCNNPLVSVLDNGFRRGFDQFYNYAGAAPTLFQPTNASLGSRFKRKFNDTFTKIADPVQRFVSHSETAFRISINPLLTPIWSRFANFKGQNALSVKHVCQFLTEREQAETEDPLFLFFNLMETHLPFWPPQEFIAQTAPYLLKDPEAQAIMRRWNYEAYRWAVPLEKPLTELEARVLSDLYDAEVAYQDAYLNALFVMLAERANRENTLTIIVGDHGDGLGEHGCVGHSFVAYEELVHVPLIMNWPREIAPATRVESAVSTRRVFHTMFAAGASPAAAIEELALTHVIAGNDVEHGRAFAEIYPPVNLVSVMETRQPELIDRFECRSLRRAVVEDGVKLIQVADQPREAYELVADPDELDNLHPQTPDQFDALNDHLDQFSQKVTQEQALVAAGDAIDLEDQQIQQQLRALGYIE